MNKEKDIFNGVCSSQGLPPNQNIKSMDKDKYKSKEAHECLQGEESFQNKEI